MADVALRPTAEPRDGPCLEHAPERLGFDRRARTAFVVADGELPERLARDPARSPAALRVAAVALASSPARPALGVALGADWTA